MEFVIWMLGFPLVVNLMEILISIRRKIDNHEPTSVDSQEQAGIMWFLIWIIVGIAIYVK